MFFGNTYTLTVVDELLSLYLCPCLWFVLCWTKGVPILLILRPAHFSLWVVLCVLSSLLFLTIAITHSNCDVFYYSLNWWHCLLCICDFIHRVGKLGCNFILFWFVLFTSGAFTPRPLSVLHQKEKKNKKQNTDNIKHYTTNSTIRQPAQLLWCCLCFIKLYWSCFVHIGS